MPAVLDGSFDLPESLILLEYDSFSRLLRKGKIMLLALPLALHTSTYTMLQQLRNLTSDDIIHGYQTSRTGVIFRLLNPG